MIRKENPYLIELIKTLYKADKAVWKRVAELLSKPRRKKVEVNISKLERYAKEGDVVVVPGKVLGSGELKKKITVAAFSFSKNAKRLIEKSGSRALSIEALYKENPQGAGVIIMR